jgi:hypothetical protein
MPFLRRSPARSFLPLLTVVLAACLPPGPTNYGPGSMGGTTPGLAFDFTAVDVEAAMNPSKQAIVVAAVDEAGLHTAHAAYVGTLRVRGIYTLMGRQYPARIVDSPDAAARIETEAARDGATHAVLVTSGETEAVYRLYTVRRPSARSTPRGANEPSVVMT